MVGGGGGPLDTVWLEDEPPPHAAIPTTAIAHTMNVASSREYR
jgi:hypothetical protein